MLERDPAPVAGRCRRPGSSMRKVAARIGIGQAPAQPDPGVELQQVGRARLVLHLDRPVPAARQELVERGHGAEDGGVVARQDGVAGEPGDQPLERAHRAGAGRADQDRVLDVGGPVPGQARRRAVIGQQLPAILQVVAQHQAAHRVGDHVEAQGLAMVALAADEPGQLLDEAVEAERRLVQAAPPVIVELERGRVRRGLGGVAGLAVAADAHGTEHVAVDPAAQRDARELAAEVGQRPVGLALPGQPVQGLALGHLQADHLRLGGQRRSGMGGGEVAPDRALLLFRHQPAAHDARGSRSPGCGSPATGRRPGGRCRRTRTSRPIRRAILPVDRLDCRFILSRQAFRDRRSSYTCGNT